MPPRRILIQPSQFELARDLLRRQQNSSQYEANLELTDSESEDDRAIRLERMFADAGITYIPGVPVTASMKEANDDMEAQYVRAVMGRTRARPGNLKRGADFTKFQDPQFTLEMATLAVGAFFPGTFAAGTLGGEATSAAVVSVVDPDKYKENLRQVEAEGTTGGLFDFLLTRSEAAHRARPGVSLAANILGGSIAGAPTLSGKLNTLNRAPALARVNSVARMEALTNLGSFGRGTLRTGDRLADLTRTMRQKVALYLPHSKAATDDVADSTSAEILTRGPLTMTTSEPPHAALRATIGASDNIRVPLGIGDEVAGPAGAGVFNPELGVFTPVPLGARNIDEAVRATSGRATREIVAGPDVPGLSVTKTGETIDRHGWRDVQYEAQTRMGAVSVMVSVDPDGIGHLDVIPRTLDGQLTSPSRMWQVYRSVFGPSKVRHVARKIFAENPEIKELRGVRVTGAKQAGLETTTRRAAQQFDRDIAPRLLEQGRTRSEINAAREMFIDTRTERAARSTEAVIPRELFHSLWFPTTKEIRDFTLFPLSNRELVRSNAIPLLPYERARTLRQTLGVPGTESYEDILSNVFGVPVPPRPHRSAVQRAAITAKATEALEDLAGAARVQEALPSILRDMQSGHGLSYIRNIQLLYSHIPAILEEYSARQGAWWRRILGSRFGRKANILPFADQVFSLSEFRLSPEAQMAGALHDNFVESVAMESVNINAILKTEIDDVFAPGSLPNPLTKQTRAYFQRIADMEQAGDISREQAHMWRVLGILEEPKAYKYKGALGAKQKALSNGVQALFNDQRNIESRGYGIDIAEVNGAYMPHLWDVSADDTSYLGNGMLTVTPDGQNKIFGTNQFFAKTRKFPLYRLALLNSKQPLRFREGIAHPADVITARVMAGSRMIADRLLTGEMKSRGISKTEQDLMKRIIGGRPLGGMQFIERFANETRAFKFGIEFAALLIQGPAAFVHMIAVAPQNAPKLLVNSLNMVMNKAAFEKWTVARRDLIQRFNRAGGKAGIHVLENDGKRAFVERDILPMIRRRNGKWEFEARAWNPVKALNDAQFGRLITYLKVETFDLLTDRFNRSGQLARALGSIGVGLPNGTDPLAAERAAAGHVNEIFGGIGNTGRWAGPNRRALERALDITPQFLNATVSQINRAFLGGRSPQAGLAREFLLKLFGLTLASIAVTEKLTTGEWPDWEKKLDPASEEFLRIKTETDIIQPAGRWGTMIRRLYASPIRDIGQLVQGRTEDLRTGREFRNLVRGRLSIPLSTIRALTEQRDFLGEALFTDEPVGLNWTTASVLGDELIMPISADQILDDLRKGEATRTSMIGVFFGLNSYPLDQEREAIRDVMTEELVRMFGAHPDSADKAVTAFDPWTAKDANGQIIQASPEDKAKLYEQVAIRLGYTDINGRPTPDDISKVRRFASDHEFTQQELATIERGEIERFFQKQTIEQAARIEAYDSISERFLAGEITLGDAFSEISDVNRAFRLHERVNDAVYADLLQSLAARREDVPVSEKEMFFLTLQAKLDETVRPDGSIDYDRRRDLLNATQAALGDERSAQWWEEFQDFTDSRDDLFPTIVRTYYELQETVRPYFEAKYDVLEGRELALFNRWEAAADDPAVQQQMLQGPDGVTIAQAKAKVENRQRQYLFSDLLSAEPDPPLQAHSGGKRMALALWILFGTGGRFGAAAERGDVANMIAKLAPGSVAPRQAVGERIATEDLSLEDLMRLTE